MFIGYKKVNSKTIYLFLNDNYEFSNEINTSRKKKMDIITSCGKFLFDHNLNSFDKVYLVSNGIILGYITRETLNKYF